jgi:hypothetical protein
VQEMVLADCGVDFVSSETAILIDKLGFCLQYTPLYRHDSKAFVERHFKTMNIALIGDKSNITTSSADNQATEETPPENPVSPSRGKANG